MKLKFKIGDEVHYKKYGEEGIGEIFYSEIFYYCNGFKFQEDNILGEYLKVPIDDLKIGDKIFYTDINRMFEEPIELTIDRIECSYVLKNHLYRFSDNDLKLTRSFKIGNILRNI